MRILVLHAGTDELRGSLVHASLDKKPAFEALSYAWGQPPFEHHIVIEGHKFNIGPNLHDALRELRNPDSNKALWIDAISINQLDDVERSQQIQMMQQIFISASQVLAWLGDAGEHGELAMTLLEDLQEEHMTKFRETDFTSPEWIALKSLWCRPYWKRIWIVQELTVANGRALIGCGSRWVPRAAFQNAIDILNAHRDDPDTLLWEALESEVDWLLNLTQTCRCDINSWGDEHLQSLEQLLYLTEQFEATVPHDHFFALLGLSREQDRLSIPIDYTPSFTIVCGTVLCHIIRSTKSLNILTGNRSKSLDNVSSWMPSFSDPVRRGYGWNSLRQFQATGSRLASVDLSPCCRILSCEGIEIGKITNVEGPFENSKSAFVNAETILRMRKIAKKALRSRSSNSHELAFWETIFANRSSSEYLDDSLNQLTKQLNDISSHLERHDAKSEADFDRMQDDLEKYLRPFMSYFVSTLRYRCFFTTSDGRIGIGPSTTRCNDLAVLLFGADVPFILRHDSDGVYYQLIGDGYIYGIMNGEMLQRLAMHESRLSNQTHFRLK
jgi:hypothetical protein